MESKTSMEMQENASTLVDGLIIAMFQPKEYKKLFQWKIGKLIRHVLFVVILASLIQYAIPVLGSIAGLGGMKEMILHEIPEFSLKDGKFYLEEKLEKRDEKAGIYFLVDTTVAEFKEEDVPKNMVQVFMVSEGNMLVYNSLYGMGGMLEQERFQNLKDYTITNETVADMSGIIYFGFFVIFMMLVVAFMIEYLGTALFYAFFLYLFVKGMVPDITFGTIYKAGLYAMTFGTILEAVTFCLGGGILYVAAGILNVLVTISLMNRSILYDKMEEIQRNRM